MQNYYPSIAAHSWPVATITAQVHDGIPSLPPSPKVADLIAALTNPENMSDDALYDAAAKAEAAMQLWQDEYFALNKQIAVNPRLYKRKHEHQLGVPTQNNEHIDTPKSPKSPKEDVRARSISPNIITNEPEKPKRSAKRARNELNIDMKERALAPEGGQKRVRKPRKVFQGGDEPTFLLDTDSTTNPKVNKKRAREPINDVVLVADEQPMAKRLRLATPSAPRARSTRARSVKKEEAAASETVVTEGKDPKKSAAMKAAWAKRQAEGTNGRHGGAPKESTKRKAAKN